MNVRDQFYTETQLMTMPLKIVRSLDIQNADQEKLVQRVVDKRLAVMPPSSPINRRDVPDILNQEDERKWQSIIDERTAKQRPNLMTIEAAVSDKVKDYSTVDLLDPMADNFNPSSIEMAEKATDQSPDVSATGRAQSVADRIKELEKPVTGQPMTLSGGVPSKLTRKAKK